LTCPREAPFPIATSHQNLEAIMQEKKGTALVTGASSGIGRETARRLAERGYGVIAAARRMDRLNELAEQVPGVTPKRVDLSRPEEVERFSEDLKTLTEPVSILINNAGYAIRGAIEDVSLASVRRLFEVNVFSLIRVTQACLPGMRRMRKGTVVNLSSMVGKFPFPMSGAYAASKHAVEAITEALRMELRPFGIRVVTIRPGPVATEFNEVANKLTGDLLAITDPDYKPVYQAAGAGVGKMFAGVSIPGPEAVADAIEEALFSSSPKPFYAVGSMADEFLGQRARLDDEAFDRFMSEKTGLAGLRV
jgi:short-subunit dehydrogenase